MIESIVGLLLAVCSVLPANGYGATVKVAVPSYSMSLIAFLAAKCRGRRRSPPGFDRQQRGFCYRRPFRSQVLEQIVKSVTHLGGEKLQETESKGRHPWKRKTTIASR